MTCEKHTRGPQLHGVCTWPPFDSARNDRVVETQARPPELLSREQQTS